MPGFALNIITDLSYFDYIIPCGMKGKPITSLEKELGRKIDIKEVQKIVLKEFEKVFQIKII
jgi:lipoyl(octanoyl) transferase